MQLGRYRVDLVSAGTFALDGGAMFGIIPKPLWEKKIPADDKNRIPLDTRVMLLRDGQRTVLVDCGMGTTWGDKEKGIYAINDCLAASLAALDVSSDDITDVVLTHLHFDHAGGLTRFAPDGTLTLTFKNARVHVTRRNFEHATHPNERDRGSYRSQSFAPLLKEERDRVVFINDNNGHARVMDDVDALVCEGHTTCQLLPLVGKGEQRALYGADMVPTRAHVPPAWHMGYDIRPLTVLEEKAKILALCAKEKILIVHEHDTQFAGTFVDVGQKPGEYMLSSPSPSTFAADVAGAA